MTFKFAILRMVVVGKRSLVGMYAAERKKTMVALRLSLVHACVQSKDALQDPGLKKTSLLG